VATLPQQKLIKMENSFKTLKNGKNAQTVFANPTTKKIVANKNSFGHNVICYSDKEFDAIATNLKRNQGKSDYTKFSYSQSDVESLGFVLVKRGENILF